MNKDNKKSSVNINWFPGHMAKAHREISDRIKIVDIIIELVDARAPESSRNPMLSEIINQKPRLMIMTKEDLADDNKTKEWINYYQQRGIKAIALNLNKFNRYSQIVDSCQDILADKRSKEQRKGLKARPIRAMVLGIPNVGKSTFINRLAKRNVAISGNRPGVTKAQQIIKVTKDFELFDTPGVLWPKFDSEIIGYNLALIAAIKQDILPLDDLVIYAVTYLVKNYPGLIEGRYLVKVNLESDWIEGFYRDVAEVRKIKAVRGYVDYDRISSLIINDIYQGNLGRITWESPNE